MQKLLSIFSFFGITMSSTLSIISFEKTNEEQKIIDKAIEQLKNQTINITVANGNESSIIDAIKNINDFKSKLDDSEIIIESFEFKKDNNKVQNNFKDNEEYEVILKIKKEDSKQVKITEDTINFKIKITILSDQQKTDKIHMDYEENIKLWKKHLSEMEQNLKDEFKNMNEQQLKDAFSGELEFGTAGLRDIIGVGSSRINIYTIGRATLGFIKFLQEKHGEENLKNQGILIGHDNRHFSKEFAQHAADIITTNNIKAILFKDNDLRPTPLVSYSIRKVRALAGIVITASHNSAKYNGYKVYDENGCQLLPIATDKIGQYYVEYKEKVFDLQLNPDNSLLRYVDKSTEEEYIKDVKSLQFYPNQSKDVKIVFSNLHGTNKDWTPKILQESGYEVIVVEKQFDNDPDFSYAKEPNPELDENFDLAIDYGMKHNADLLLLNDPDADRVRIAVKLKKDKYHLMTGNETAAVLIEYLFSHYKDKNILPVNGVMYNTFVSSNLTDKIADSYGVKVVKTLTGFKWISEQMLLEEERNLKFLFAFEETCGYVIDKNITYDKDGIHPSLVLAEACQYYKNQNLNLYEVLENIFKKYGYYYCDTINLVCEGASGKNEIQKMLNILRDSTISFPDEYNLKLTKKEDFLNGLYGLPSQDFLKFYFEDGSWFAVRPSGTEPKIKFYFVCVDKSVEKAKSKMEKMYSYLSETYLNKSNEL